MPPLTITTAHPNLIDHLTYRGLTINILADDDPISPRDWSNLGIMATSHSRYLLGDEEPSAWFERVVEASDRDLITTLAAIIAEHDPTCILPLYLLDHSGLAISSGPDLMSHPDHDPTDRTRRFAMDGAGWDTSFVGFIFDSAETRQLLLPTNSPHETVLSILEQEVEIYNQYLTGDVYGYVVTDDNGDVIDSCFGFFGDDELLSEARSVIDHHIANDLPSDHDHDHQE